MRYFHTVSVSESALRKHKRMDVLVQKLGQGIIDVCLGVDGRDTLDVRKEVEARGLIQYCGEFGSIDRAYYGCTRGRLVTLFDLNEGEVRDGLLSFQMRLEDLARRSRE